MALQIAHGLLRATQICVCVCTMSMMQSTLGEKNKSHCAYFEFFNISDSTVNVAENTQVEVTFSLIENCTNVSLYFMTIYNFHIQKSIYIPACRIAIKDNVCVPETESALCRCLTQNGFYLFKKTFLLSDYTKWKWSSTGNASDIIREFNVTYPSKILSLTVDEREDTDVVSTRKKILIRCSLKKGNPATKVQLLNNNTTIWTSKGDLEEIIYTISFVHCLETGIIVCKSDGSRNRVTATYDERCPPAFLNTTLECYNSSLDVLSVTFLIYAAPTQLTDCMLTRHLKQEHVSVFQKHQCHANSSTPKFFERKCACIINGTVPYLSLTAYIFDVSENDDGEWNITISNKAGSTQHTFCVHVYDNSAKEVNNDPPNLVSIAFVVGAVGITIISCVACKFIAKRVNCHHAWRNKTLIGPADHSHHRTKDNASCSNLFLCTRNTDRKNNISKSAALFPIISLDAGKETAYKF